MKYLELEIFNDFECVGSACPFTCCAGGWKILVDPESAAYYKSVTGDFGIRLAECVKEEKGQNSFALTEDGRCSFLNEKNLCDIYINLGPEHLCYTCKAYPRYRFAVGDVYFSGVSISCPEVARFFLCHEEKLKIDFFEDDRNIKIDSKFDWIVFNYSIRAFTAAVELAQNRTLTISERLAVLTLFMFQFQTHIDGKTDPSGVIELFSNSTYYTRVLPQMCIYQRDLNSKAEFIIKCLGVYGARKSVDKDFPELSDLISHFVEGDNFSFSGEQWNAAYDALTDEKTQLWMEQLLVYTLYRYFMQGVKKKDFYTKYLEGIILIFELCISTVILYYLRWEKKPELEELILIVAHSSRALEHNNKMLDDTIEYFKEKGVTDPAFLLKLFS